jgi:Uma2 family endonuclease
MSTAELETPVVLGPELNGTSMTPEEFDAVEEADELYVYELIRGVLVVSPPPLITERSPNEILGVLLFNYREQHPQGSALDWTAPEHLVKTVGNRRRADRVIWAGLGRMPDTRRDLPKIVAEFVSAGKRSRRRDYEEKRQEYQACNIAEYWLFDRFRRIMTVFRNQAGRLSKKVIHEHEVYRTPLLPGFELPLTKIFSVVDMLEGARRKKPSRTNGKGTKVGKRKS